MDPIFLDFVSSNTGLDAFPIEVGWAFTDGRCERHLIYPPAEWLDCPRAWSAAHEAVHGLTQHHLILQGEKPENVATRMNGQLDEQALHAFAPRFDALMLSKLFRAAGDRPWFQLADIGARGAIDRLAEETGVRGRALSWAEQEAARIAPWANRAGPDALHLATLWKLVALGPEILEERRRNAAE